MTELQTLQAFGAGILLAGAAGFFWRASEPNRRDGFLVFLAMFPLALGIFYALSVVAS